MLGGYEETYYIKPEQVMDRAELTSRERDVLSDLLGLSSRSSWWGYEEAGIPKTIT